MVRLGNDPDFEKFMGWLGACREESISDMLVQPQTNLLFQSQGASLALDGVMRTIQSARAALERHSSGGAVNT